MVLAVIIPLAVTAGKPIPEKVEFPQQYNPAIGVNEPGKKSRSAQIAGL